MAPLMAGQMPVVVVSGGWGGADSPKGAVAGLLRPPHRFHFLLSFPDITAHLASVSLALSLPPIIGFPFASTPV